jgi:hypothetical protein
LGAALLDVPSKAVPEDLAQPALSSP